jgi:hypothetical protein
LYDRGQQRRGQHDARDGGVAVRALRDEERHQRGHRTLVDVDAGVAD